MFPPEKRRKPGRNIIIIQPEKVGKKGDVQYLERGLGDRLSGGQYRKPQNLFPAEKPGGDLVTFEDSHRNGKREIKKREEFKLSQISFVS